MTNVSFRHSRLDFNATDRASGQIYLPCTIGGVEMAEAAAENQMR